MKLSRFLLSLLAFALGASACGADSDLTTEAVAEADTEGVTVTLVTHDSFLVTEGIFDSFTSDTGIEVEILSAGDAGELVSRSILTAGQPEGDVLFGIDNTFLQRGLDNDLFVPFESELLSTVPDSLKLDSENRVTPIDYGDVCVNYWIDSLPGGQIPTSIEDLAMPEFASSFVTQDPEQSSPGFAFLLATISALGDDWESYWESLVANGLAIGSGWTETYYGDFVAGGGERALVTSYATSPAAEVLFSEEPIDTPPTGVLADSCFRQVEFAGILRGTEHPEAAAKLIDFMLSAIFQEDIPLNMFVFPANGDAALPEVFSTHSVAIDSPLSLTPAEIEENRLAWTERWTEIVRG
jgi:thiamine transport system substrate-binding protein